MVCKLKHRIMLVYVRIHIKMHNIYVYAYVRIHLKCFTHDDKVIAYNLISQYQQGRE